MSLHGIDHRLAFGLHRIEIEFRIERENLERIGVRSAPVGGEIGASIARLAVDRSLPKFSRAKPAVESPQEGT